MIQRLTHCPPLDRPTYLQEMKRTIISNYHVMRYQAICMQNVYARMILLNHCRSDFNNNSSILISPTKKMSSIICI